MPARTERLRTTGGGGWRQYKDIAQGIAIVGALLSVVFWTHFQTRANAAEISAIKAAVTGAADDARTRQEAINEELVKQSGVNGKIEERTKSMDRDIQEILRIMRSTSR